MFMEILVVSLVFLGCGIFTTNKRVTLTNYEVLNSKVTYMDLLKEFVLFNRYRRKRPKVDASIFDSALSHTRRLDSSEKRPEKSVSTFGRFRLSTSLESSPVSVHSLIFIYINFYYKNYTNTVYKLIHIIVVSIFVKFMMRRLNPTEGQAATQVFRICVGSSLVITNFIFSNVNKLY